MGAQWGVEEMEDQAGEVGRGCVMCLIKRGKEFGFSLMAMRSPWRIVFGGYTLLFS